MKQWVNAERTILVVEHDDERLTCATRPDSDAIWGPPVALEHDENLAEFERRQRERRG